MSLYQDWQELIDNQTEETFESFWKEYAETETKLYAHILENHTEHLTGTVAELVDKFECNKTQKTLPLTLILISKNSSSTC